MQDTQKCYYFSEILEHLDLLEISYSSPFNWEENEKISLEILDLSRSIGVKCFYVFEPGSEIKTSLDEFSKKYITNNKQNIQFEIGISYKKKGEFLYNNDEAFQYSLFFENKNLGIIRGFKYSQVYPVAYKDNIKLKKEILVNKRFREYLKNEDSAEDLIVQLLLLKDRKFKDEHEYREIVHFSEKEKKILANDKIYFTRKEKAYSILILKDPFNIKDNSKEEKLFKLVTQACENKIKVEVLNDCEVKFHEWYVKYLEKMVGENKYDKNKFKSEDEFINYHVNIFNNLVKEKEFLKLDKKAY